MGKRKSLFEEEVEMLPEEPVLKVNQDFAKRFEVRRPGAQDVGSLGSAQACHPSTAVAPVAAITRPPEGTHSGLHRAQWYWGLGSGEACLPCTCAAQ